MTSSFIPIPVNFGDTYGSTIAVMLFPEDLDRARSWHAKHLSTGALQAYLNAGHSFQDRFPAFIDAVGGERVDRREALKRLTGANLAAETMKVLWALVCDDDPKAGWNYAIDRVCAATATGESGSPSHIRKQLKLFAPVMHLWLGWQLSESACPPEDELFNIGYPILFALRAWEQTRPAGYHASYRYLAVSEFGPWPDLARQMELGGGYPRSLSLRQGVQRRL
jgi:hypothetical protein